MGKTVKCQRVSRTKILLTPIQIRVAQISTQFMTLKAVGLLWRQPSMHKCNILLRQISSKDKSNGARNLSFLLAPIFYSKELSVFGVEVSRQEIRSLSRQLFSIKMNQQLRWEVRGFLPRQVAWRA